MFIAYKTCHSTCGRVTFFFFYYIIDIPFEEGEKMNSVEIGKFIALQRRKKSLTQKELAEKLNVTDKAISKWETGKCYPDIEMLEKLSCVLEVSINELLSGKFLEPEQQKEAAEKNVIEVLKTSKRNQKKWKVVALILSFITVFAFVFAVAFNFDKETPKHQYLSSTVADFDSEKSMRITIAEIGLKDVLVCQVDTRVDLIDDSVGSVYLLADNRYDTNSIIADYYLVISINGKIFAKDLSSLEEHSSLAGKFYCIDIDGDGDKEIVLQETVGMTGGAGQYLSRIFNFKNGEINEIFSSYNKGFFDTGFSFSILQERNFKIENKFTGYSEKFSLADRTDEYYSNVWYDENNKPQKRDLILDSFYIFEPYDIDNDGVYEIKCCQYTWLYNHPDFIGTAVSFLKYDVDTGAFIVCDAYFESGKMF